MHMQRFAILFILGTAVAGGNGLYAQSGGQSKMQGSASNNAPTEPAPFFVSGKVRMDDDTPLPGPAEVQSICRGQGHTEGHTDSKGSFTFELGKQANVGEDIGNDTGASRPGRASSDMNAMPSMQGQVLSSRNFRDCQVQAVLPGFVSQVVDVVKRGDWGSVDVGTIHLHRPPLAAAMISVTTAAAPATAVKAFEKGRDEERKHGWDAARKQFEKAVGDYPKFAEAWVELGRMEEQQKDFAAAQVSFKHAVEADSNLATPYHELAGIAFDQEKWTDVLDMTSHVLKLSPEGFPDDWFYSAAGYYSLHRYDEAEKYAREGLKLDTEHRIPRMEYLLGVVLVQQRNYSEAMEHMRSYLRLAPKAPDAGTVTQQVAELERVVTAQAASKK
jgi:tetratricopeptide (TPR) repeat protein